jgi:hypothetical protein
MIGKMIWGRMIAWALLNDWQNDLGQNDCSGSGECLAK